MYKETAKAGKKAIGPAILWVVFMYFFYIIWGVCQILIGITPPPVIKHLVLWLLTGWFGWVLVAKIMIEYEFAARKNEFTVEKRLSKRSQIIASIKYSSIKGIYTDKGDIENIKFFKRSNLIRAFQGGQTIYIVYDFDSKTNLIYFKASRKMLQVLNEHTKESKEV